MNYFLTNYYGSRAPIDVGNHFSPWNGGAYFNGLMKFISNVCGNPKYPEVKCLNYYSLVQKLEEAEAKGLLKQWKAQNFEKELTLSLFDSERNFQEKFYDLSIQFEKNKNGELEILLSGDDSNILINKGRWYLKLYKQNDIEQHNQFGGLATKGKLIGNIPLTSEDLKTPLNLASLILNSTSQSKSSKLDLDLLDCNHQIRTVLFL